MTDVGMPGGMSGRQLADAARVRVLIVTGYAETTLVTDGSLEPGMQVMASTAHDRSCFRALRALFEEKRGFQPGPA